MFFMSPRPATAVDVAKRAGLSRSTVSQILNGYGDRFLDDTRERVEAAAAELNYRPSRAGRALVTGVADIVVVVVPHVTFGGHLQDTLDQVTRATEPHGLSVLLRYADDDTSVTLQTVLDLRPAAVLDLGVFDAEQRETIRSAGSRVVPRVDNPQLDEDPNHLVGRMQVTHVLRNGPRQIIAALLSDSRADVFGPPRAQGYADAVAELGGPAPIVVRVPLDRAGAVAALTSALSGTGPFGVCCYNDDVAMAVVAACQDLGLSVPEQVAVIGVDRTPAGQLFTPRLTTVTIDMPRIVEQFFADFDLSTTPTDLTPFVQHLEEHIALVPGDST